MLEKIKTFAVEARKLLVYLATALSVLLTLNLPSTVLPPSLVGWITLALAVLGALGVYAARNGNVRNEVPLRTRDLSSVADAGNGSMGDSLKGSEHGDPFGRFGFYLDAGATVDESDVRCTSRGFTYRW